MNSRLILARPNSAFTSAGGWCRPTKTTICSGAAHLTQPVDGPIGYKLEATPLHPVIFASTLPGIGRQQTDL